MQETEKSGQSGIQGLSDDERQPCEVWTRVMGYARPLAYFNPGKQQEHADRVHYTERKAYHHTDFGVIEMDRPFGERKE